MEANRDGAETCVVRAEAALREQDFAKALRLLVKAKGLYPLDNLDAKIRAVSAKVPAAADEERASTPVPPGDVGDALARKRAREEEGAEAGSKKPAAVVAAAVDATSQSPAGTDISAASASSAGYPPSAASSATTADAGAPAEPPPPEYDWQTSGHEWIGAFVARTFGKRTAVGRITKWVPPDEEDGAL